MQTQHYAQTKEETEYFCSSNQTVKYNTSLDSKRNSGKYRRARFYEDYGLEWNGNTCILELYFVKIVKISDLFTKKN